MISIMARRRNLRSRLTQVNTLLSLMPREETQAILSTSLDACTEPLAPYPCRCLTGVERVSATSQRVQLTWETLFLCKTLMVQEGNLRARVVSPKLVVALSLIVYLT